MRPLRPVFALTVAATLAIAATLAVACSPREKHEPAPSKPEPCARIGQNCEVAPGKLGTCVLKEMCTDPPPACFVCQSQH
ncbi:hypothetical protein [Pendulispora albinea]|uniref:Lipoprotein n=1 Tax=Pendulispora albinea TaxID=2741071 RepID=A0ABZ2M4Z7_9BACT